MGGWFLASGRSYCTECSVLVQPSARAAVRWFRKSAMAGNADGQNYLAGCLSSGNGVMRDDAEALRWYKRAVRGERNFCAVMNLAKFYRDHGNHRRAMFWHQRAASWGDGDAFVEVGRSYYAGVGVKRDPQRGVRCFRKAIRSENITQWGREDAMYSLALAFHEGPGVRKSDGLTMKWLLHGTRTGISSGSESACCALRRRR